MPLSPPSHTHSSQAPIPTSQNHHNFPYASTRGDRRNEGGEEGQKKKKRKLILGYRMHSNEVKKAIKELKQAPMPLSPHSHTHSSQATQCNLTKPPQLSRGIQCTIILEEEQWPVPDNLILFSENNPYPFIFYFFSSHTHSHPFPYPLTPAHTHSSHAPRKIR
jgi:hypothetical protein